MVAPYIILCPQSAQHTSPENILLYPIRVISRVKLAKPVAESGEIVIDANQVSGIDVIIDSDVPHTVLRESEVHVHSNPRGITAQTGKVFREYGAHMP
ncbi:MAG: hypothetical protein J1E43_12130, partial [Christensenellaceae bacterium]|nr:hypothetical protein [Christensenellaceae bacterium]